MVNRPTSPASGQIGAFRSNTSNTFPEGSIVRVYLVTDGPDDEPFTLLVTFADTLGIAGHAAVRETPTETKAVKFFPWSAVESVTRVALEG